VREGWQADGTYWRTDQHVVHWSTLDLLVDTTQLIDWFDDFLGTHPYVALSNFHEGEPFTVGGIAFRTAEHAFHVGKAVHERDRQCIAAAADANEAKIIGRSIEMREDWDTYRVEHMRATLAAKFAPDRHEAVVLMSTGVARLVEGTLWRDEFWGVNLELSGRPGRNMLGELLTERRAALKLLT
jgi:ribA/ribD-fused uncharacterized protein